MDIKKYYNMKEFLGHPCVNTDNTTITYEGDISYYRLRKIENLKDIRFMDRNDFLYYHSLNNTYDFYVLELCKNKDFTEKIYYYPMIRYIVERTDVEEDKPDDFEHRVLFHILNIFVIKYFCHPFLSLLIWIAFIAAIIKVWWF